jgi:hypothetical protein
VRAFVRGDLLGILEETAVKQIDGDTGQAEAVAADPGEESPTLAARRAIMRCASWRVMRLPVSCLRAAQGGERWCVLFVSNACGRRDIARAGDAPAFRAACRPFSSRRTHRALALRIIVATFICRATGSSLLA